MPELDASDITAMHSDVRHILLTVGEIKALIKELNGRLDANERRVDVLTEFRYGHDAVHVRLEERVSRNAVLNGIATGILGAIAAFFGLNK